MTSATILQRESERLRDSVRHSSTLSGAHRRPRALLDMLLSPSERGRSKVNGPR
jgi:hypothetical protein